MYVGLRAFLALTAAAAVSLTAGACVSPPQPPGPALAVSSAAASSGSTSSTRTIAIPSKAKVQKALLAAADLGSGYSAVAPANSPATGLGTSLAGCADESGAPAEAVAGEAVYQGSAVGPFVAETITVSSEAEAERTMSDLLKVTKNCARFNGQMASGTEMEIAIDQLTFPVAGDSTVAYRLTMSVPGAGAVLYADLVTVRVGNVVLLVALITMGAPDVSQTEQLVEDAIGKLRSTLFT